MNIFGIAIAFAGVILFLAALLATIRANHDAPIPAVAIVAIVLHNAKVRRLLS